MNHESSIGLWQGEIDGKELTGEQYDSGSGYGIFIAREDDEHAYLGLLNSDACVGYTRIARPDAEVLDLLFLVTAEPKKIERAGRGVKIDGKEYPALSPFKEKRAIGTMYGLEIRLSLEPGCTLRTYQNLPLFPDQWLYALTRGGREYACVAFDEEELFSISGLLSNIFE